MKKFFCLIAVVLLAACAGSTPFYTPPPRAGLAKVIIFYPAPFVGKSYALQVRMPGESCNLDSGRYIVREVTPGRLAIAVSVCGFPGVSRANIIVSAGEKYYIRVRPYDSTLLGMVSGYPNPNDTVKDKTAPAPSGPLAIDRLSEADAIPMLESLEPQPR